MGSDLVKSDGNPQLKQAREGAVGHGANPPESATHKISLAT